MTNGERLTLRGEANLIFVLPPNVYVPPGRGDVSVSNFHRFLDLDFMRFSCTVNLLNLMGGGTAARAASYAMRPPVGGTFGFQEVC